MISRLQSFASSHWRSWDKKADWHAERFIQGTSVFFDPPMKHLMTNEFQTQTKIMVFWLATLATLQTTSVTPLLPVYFGYPLGVLTLVFVGRPLLRHLKSHIDVCRNEFSAEKRLLALAVPMVLCGINASLFYAAKFSSAPKAPFPVVFWLMALNAGTSLLFHCALLLGERLSPVKSTEREILKVIPEIVELRFKIKMLDRFVRSRPELLQLCLECLSKHRFSFPFPPLKLNVNEQDNIFKKWESLEKHKIALEYHLNQRIYFIRRYPQLYECFSEHVMRDQADMQAKRKKFDIYYKFTY